MPLLDTILYIVAFAVIAYMLVVAYYLDSSERKDKTKSRRLTAGPRGPQGPQGTMGPPGQDARAREHAFELKFLPSIATFFEADEARQIKAQYGSPQTAGSAAFDLYYVGLKTLHVSPGEVHLVNTGIAIHLKDPAVVGKIYPRSSLGVKGLILANTVGIVDSDYQEEIKVALCSRRDHDAGPIVVEPGARIAQLVIEPICIPNPTVVDEFSENTDRGGFGSTGQ